MRGQSHLPPPSLHLDKPGFCPLSLLAPVFGGQSLETSAKAGRGSLCRDVS